MRGVVVTRCDGYKVYRAVRTSVCMYSTYSTWVYGVTVPPSRMIHPAVASRPLSVCLPATAQAPATGGCGDDLTSLQQRFLVQTVLDNDRPG